MAAIVQGVSKVIKLLALNNFIMKIIPRTIGAVSARVSRMEGN